MQGKEKTSQTAGTPQSDWLQELAPYHIVTDASGNVLGSGPKLQRFLPENWLHTPLNKLVTITRPQEPEFSKSALTQQHAWEIRLPNGLHLEGQWRPHGEEFVLLCQLAIQSVDELEAFGLSLADLSPHDNTANLLALLHRQQTNVENVHEVVADRVKEAEASARNQSTFLANISHEIRTPMNGLLGLTDTLLDDGLTVKQKELAGSIKESGQRLMHVLKDVFDFSQLDDGKLRLRPQQARTRDIFDRVIELTRARAEANAIAVTLNMESNLYEWIEIDAPRMIQILYNLVDNAIKFTPSEGRVDVHVYQQHGTLHCSVADTGIGIETARLQDVFKPFRQIDEGSARVNEGTGLGLTLTVELVHLMGGDIHVESSPGEGSTFSISIPVVAAEPPSQAAKPEPARQLKVLVVDDNMINLKVAQNSLEKSGFHVTTADNGKTAIKAICEDSFDLVLMDCHMPVMDGFEATRRIREMNITIPVIALTADALNEAEDACLQSGMNAVLTKPFTRDHLQRTLRSFIEA